MPDLPTRERRPARGGVASRKHSHKESAERLRSYHTRSRSPVSTEINVAALSRAFDAFISATTEIKDSECGADQEPTLAATGSPKSLRGPRSASATTTWRGT